MKFQFAKKELLEHYYDRIITKRVERSLQNNPVTAILGPRQCGKSTLVKRLIRGRSDAMYLDLERPSDLQKLSDPEWFLGSQADKLICLDEIHRKPELFSVLRSLVDEYDRNGRFLILGSASRGLLRQSSETLAGRISYKHLTPLLWEEIQPKVSIEAYLSRGGFPRSLLAASDLASYEWRQDFITTFLERDLLQFAGFPPQTMRRLWTMLAHNNGQSVNLTKFGTSLGVSHTSIRHYLDLLEGTFMVKQVFPYRGHSGKRLVKSPKVYLTDTGLICALLQLPDYVQAVGHPVWGSLWESLVLLNLLGHFPGMDVSYYRNSQGHEVDFLVKTGKFTWAIECKASLSPSLQSGTYKALEDIQPDHTFVVSPISAGYAMKPGVDVVSLSELLVRLRNQ